MKVYQAFQVEAPDELKEATSFVAGLECEIEAVRNPNRFGIFRVDKDGSLRNNGYEFISQPAPKEMLLDAFKYLHDNLQFQKGEDPFSVRTSTHVHVNCCSLETEQVRTMVLLYALFEEFFFMLVKPVRRDNIHCVPLTETQMPSVYRHNLAQYFKNWHKYTALNLRRLGNGGDIPGLGTVEFRHLHGTKDVAEVETWLNVLENLWKMCQRVEISAKTLNHETITEWFTTLFAPSPRILSMRPSLFEICRNNLIDVKFSTI